MRMKKVEFIEILKERNRYAEKKTSVFARLMTYFLSLVLLFFLLLFLINKFAMNFLFSLVISLVVTFFISMQIFLFIKRKYTNDIQSKKYKFLLQQRINNLYLLTEHEIKELALDVILKKCNKDKFEKQGAFFICDNYPIAFFIIGGKGIKQCCKIRMFMNMGYSKVIAVCSEEQKNMIEKLYPDKIYKIVTDTEIAEAFDFLEYYENIPVEFDILNIFNKKTASVFFRLSALFAVIGILSGNMKYFGGMCFVFCTISVSIKIISLVKARK